MRKLSICLIAITALLLPLACFGQGGPSAFQYQQNQFYQQQQNMIQQQQLREMQRQTQALEDIAQQQRRNQQNGAVLTPIQPYYGR